MLNIELFEPYIIELEHNLNNKFRIGKTDDSIRFVLNAIKDKQLHPSLYERAIKAIAGLSQIPLGNSLLGGCCFK